MLTNLAGHLWLNAIFCLFISSLTAILAALSLAALSLAALSLAALSLAVLQRLALSSEVVSPMVPVVLSRSLGWTFHE